MPQAPRFPHPIPYGWYFVGYGAELADGEIRSLRYFGRDLVLFRGEDGKAGMLDAYCPHQGVHLGQGGRIDGGLIRCPFHSWGFDAEGWCRDIPYAPVMPKICYRQAITHGYPLREANGVIWAWRHPRNIDPCFDVEVCPEFTDPAWATPTRFEWRRAVGPQQAAERLPQMLTALWAAPQAPDVYEAHVRRTSAPGAMASSDESMLRTAPVVRSVTNGPGQMIITLEGPTTVSLMVLVTPVEADEAEVRFAFTHPKVEPGSSEAAALDAACRRITSLPLRDNEIDRAKSPNDQDDRSLRFHRWFEQFYVHDDEPQQDAAE